MDRIYFSLWLRGFTQHNMVASYELLLRLVPYSRLRGDATLTVLAVNQAEPPLLERRFDAIPPADELAAMCREFDSPDCAYQLETWWDLFQLDDQGDWKLQPAPLTLTCHAPLFESGLGEQFLVDFGTDVRFLPAGTGRAEMMATHSNILSLLHFTTDIGRNMPLEKKTLWSESGENLAERLEAILDGR